MAREIATLTEDIEELKNEKALLCNLFYCADDHTTTEVRQRVASIETSLIKLEQQDDQYTAELDAALVQYAKLRQ